MLLWSDLRSRREGRSEDRLRNTNIVMDIVERQGMRIKISCLGATSAILRRGSFWRLLASTKLL
jgi:hypothetical protein